jgi:hypothetical protein
VERVATRYFNRVQEAQEILEELDLVRRVDLTVTTELAGF